MKIAFMLGGFISPGGIGRVVSILANALAERYPDIGITIITQDIWDPSQHVYKFNDTIDGISLNDPVSMKKLMLNGGTKHLSKILKERNIDVVIACGALYFPISVLASRQCGIKCICWEHSNAINKCDHKFQMESRWFGTKFSDLIVTLTKQDMKLYKKKFHVKNITQIYNPVDPKAFNNTNYNSSSRKVITVGRLTYQKNYDSLIRVANAFFSQCPDWTWDIYGEGEEYQKILNLITENSLNEHLFLKGNVNDLYSRYPDYSYQVMTSRYEGFSMSLLEASANSLPIVAFDVPCGPNEIIVNEKNGYLVPAFDENKMAECMIKLSNSQPLRELMSKANKEIISHFEVGEIVDKWIQTLNKLLN